MKFKNFVFLLQRNEVAGNTVPPPVSVRFDGKIPKKKTVNITCFHFIFIMDTPCLSEDESGVSEEEELNAVLDDIVERVEFVEHTLLDNLRSLNLDIQTLIQRLSAHLASHTAI